jgi:predicted aspartyl protease
MSPRVQFEHELQYRELIPYGFLPILDVTLRGPTDEDDLIAVVDTGAKYCLFDGRRASGIGLELGNGRLEVLGGLAGNLNARIHMVTLEVLGHSFECEVAFSEQEIRRELLGRHMFFTEFRFGFREGVSLFYFHPTK